MFININNFILLLKKIYYNEFNFYNKYYFIVNIFY